MIPRNTLEKYPKQLDMQKYIVSQIAPDATFVFVGIDEKYIYFNVVAKKRNITQAQIRDLKEKTRIYPISEKLDRIYKLECKVEIM